MDGSLCSGPEGQCLRQEAEALFCEDVLHRAPFLSCRFDQVTLGHVLEVSYKGSPLEGQAIGQFCNFWWIVTSVHLDPDDMPDLWGLMTYDHTVNKLKVTKKAPRRDALPLTAPMVAAILRRSQEVVTPDTVIQAAKAEGYEAGLSAGKIHAKQDTDNLQRLRDRIRVIEKKSGVKIDGWEPAENIGDAMAAILNGNQQRQVEQLRRCATVIAMEFGIDEGHLETEAAYNLREFRNRKKR